MVRVTVILLILLVFPVTPLDAAPRRQEGLSQRGKVFYKPQWVSVMKKGRLFKYKRKEFSSPRLYKKWIFVGSDAGLFYCLKKKGGRKSWRFQTVGSINSAPAFWEGAGSEEGDDLVFIGDEKGFLYALSVEKGALKWKRDLGSEILAAPAGGRDLIVVATLEGKVTALNPTDGEVVWEKDFPPTGPLFQMTIHGNSSPVIDREGGRLYVGFADGILRALSPSDGRLIWERHLAKANGGFNDIDGAPLSEADRLFVATFDGQVFALSKKKGDLLWSQPIGSGVRLLSEGGRLYVSGSDGHLYALSKKDGSKVWDTKIGVGALTAPVVYREILAVGLSSATINFIRLEDGKILARRFARKGIFSDPIIEKEEGRILYLSNGGRLYSLRFVK